MKITLFQIVSELDDKHLMFRNLNFIKNANNNTVPAELYEVVYDGDMDIKSLEEAFYIFNMAHPEDYTGRSMSISDVIKISFPSGESRFYFCDTCGFSEIEFNENKTCQS